MSQLVETIAIPKTVSVCPSCGFHTKHNGRLEHEGVMKNGKPCPLRGSQKPEAGEMLVPREPTDAMRRAAWAVWPHSDAPYTEIYKAMLAAAAAWSIE